MKRLRPLLLVGFLLIIGCDYQVRERSGAPRDQRVAESGQNKVVGFRDATSSTEEDGSARLKDVLAMAEPKEAAKQAPGMPGGGAPGGMPGGMGPAAQPAAGNAQAPAQPVARKIVYTADLRIVVENLDQASQRVTEVVQENGGYIAQSDSFGLTGQPRNGQWRIRVPVARFQDCVAALLKLGVPEKNGTDSKDVTEEYYDLEARIKNLKVEEGRLQGYLEDKKATSKLEDILAIERELTRVRGEIDQAEGRRRMLGNLAELATISLMLREEKGYVPPEAPTFAGRVASTFLGSVTALRQFGEGVVLVAAALAPWLPLLALAAVVVLLVLRRWRPARPSVATVLPADSSGTPGS